MSYQDWDWLEVLCQDFDRARSLTVLLLVRYGEWDQLAKLKCDPSDYCTLYFPRKDLGVLSTSHHCFHTVDDFRFDYQASELLRKCSDLPLTEANPKEAAKAAFWDSEHQCAETNIRLGALQRQMHNDWYLPSRRIDARWQEVIKVWRRITREILGNVPNDLLPKFSSGSTFDDRLFILPQDKMSSRPTVTADAYQVLEPIWRKTLWFRGLASDKPNRSSPKITLGDRFTTVPKTALTDRGICVGPSLNVTYQLSVGKHIRKRLSMLGIDLDYGQYTHQRLAEQASLTLDLATIDLQSASDTVSSKLVEMVLPRMWFDLLDSLRCKHTKIEGSWRKLEKFSAMGNGYTFELETLVFYTLGLTVCEVLGIVPKTLKVYGDDIICDTSFASAYVTALKFFGFIPNKRKTFIGGIPFRESCGGDYYRGFNTRGYYLERIPKEPIDYLKLANGIRRMAKPDLDAYGDLYRYKRSWLRVISLLPTSVTRCRGPEYYGDVCLHDTADHWRFKYKRGIKYIRTLQPCYDESSITSYDRRFWTRDSILAAIALGLLQGQGDSHITRKDGTWKVIPGWQRLARSEPIGYQIKDIPFFFCDPKAEFKFENQLYDALRFSAMLNEKKACVSTGVYKAPRFTHPRLKFSAIDQMVNSAS